MKTPLRGEFKLVPTNLPEPIKKELLQESSPRYIWVALQQPIRQIGHDFSFLVLPVKMTPELVFKQCGKGVLCQTEAEMKESLELLSESAKERIVLAEAPGFGTFGKSGGARHVITEQSVRTRVKEGGQREWWALEREIDKATGEVTVLRRQEAADEAAASRIAKGWLAEYEEGKQRYLDSIEKSNTPPPPPRCQTLTQTDIKDDLPAAKSIALKRQWPHTFEIFEKRKTNPKASISEQECQDAYLLDLAEQGHDPKTETIRDDLNLRVALAKAARRFARRGKKKVTDLAVYLIAYNYELGWCYLSNVELAAKLTEILKISFTAEEVKKYRYRTLGLPAKHLTGPPPKSS